VKELLDQYREAVRRTHSALRDFSLTTSEYMDRLAVECGIGKQITDAFKDEYQRGYSDGYGECENDREDTTTDVNDPEIL